jgi:hypothetical protein
MQLNYQKPERKARKRRPGRDNPQPGEFQHGPVGKSAQPTPVTRYAVYSAGQDRLGSYGQAGDAWVALDRLGQPLGVYASQQAAIDAIERRSAP